MFRVAYVGGVIPPPFNSLWGGTTATNYCFQKAFENDEEYEIDILPRAKITSPEDIKNFCKGADIIHCDDSGIVELMYISGMSPPDVFGPICRSPLKEYGGQRPKYPADWFYQAKVIRLNYSEERKDEDLATPIIHGIDTELLKPVSNPNRKYVLWVGQKNRAAKNYDLWKEIQEFELPKGYEYKTLSNYPIQEYWDVLKDAAVLVNTSLYESFCNAAFEAMASGVPVVWRKRLQGGLWENAGIRVSYDAKSYNEAILDVLDSFKDYSLPARAHVENNNTLKHMRSSYARVYDNILKIKRGKKC